MAPRPKKIRPGKGPSASTARASKSRTVSRTAKTKPKPGGKAERAAGTRASQLIDERIRSLGDWRAETLAEVRRLIHEADPDIVEEWKWMGTPVWSHAGNVCTGETYKQVVKLTFPRGTSLKDPRRLFNSSLEGSTRRAIDIREGEALDAEAFKTLIQAAVAENLRAGAPKAKTPSKSRAKTPVLLSGGNPQIAKAEGDAPVQAYIAAMPGWKRDVGKRLDALIARQAPRARKAVKWNSPFYGIEGQGWFLSVHVFTRYEKVTFFRGTSLRPVPPGGTGKDARWIDIHEGDLDEKRMAKWVKQAAALPGWLT